MSKPMIKPIVATVALAATSIALLAPTGGAQQPAERTFKIIETDDSASFGDVAPRSPNRRNPRISGGDIHVFTSRLSNPTGKRVGRLDSACIAVRGGKTFSNARFQCDGVFTLPDGLIAVSVSFAASQEDEDVPLVITGGTGAYEGARGHVTARNLPGERMEDTFHLLP